MLDTHGRDRVHKGYGALSHPGPAVIVGRGRSVVPTLETVAASAGVSRATVSRVVNRSPTVSPQIRATVEEAISRLGYVPNRAARSLVTRRTDSVAVVMREPVEFGFADPYLSSVVVAAGQSLVGTGVQLVVMMAQDDDGHASLLEYVRAGHVDGVILLSAHDGDPLPSELARSGVPLVVGGRTSRRLQGVPCVDADNVGGGALAAGRLLSTGRKRLAILAGPADMPSATDRLAGFRNTLAAAGHPADLVAYGDWTRASGESAMGELLRRDPGLDGVFVASDLMATGALQALRSAGRRVPEDVAVVGFDDIDMAAHTDPPLTTVRQEPGESARTMVSMLLSQVRGEEATDSVTLPTRLIVRRSG